ncbi:MAG: hypothetical protein EWM47_05640 [Anaerolineaceae bacterium]|nr:MAG: hypothetical protein EWM47_05640 [Anaerolineaceae bacterium]
MKEHLKPVIELADSIIRQKDSKMKWMWGEALLGYALSELDDYLESNRYTDFLKAYCDYYVVNKPRVDQSDTSAPALITYAMQKKTGNSSYAKLTNRVLEYIKNEPRIMDEAVNHLGNSLEGKLYPKSIWVDSLMMFSVFPTRYASENEDTELLDFAARQPRLYASYMQNEKDHLWHHSYWVKPGRPYPRNLYWGRGNGWVICSLPMILQYLPENHKEQEEILQILRSTSKALLPYQRQDGYFETILNRPGKTYREASATALIAAGWFEGARCGWLPLEYADYAMKAYKELVSNLIYRKGEVYLPEISGPTIPLQLLPYPGYKLIPRAENWSYGVAAMIFAGIACDKWLNNR